MQRNTPDEGMFIPQVTQFPGISRFSYDELISLKDRLKRVSTDDGNQLERLITYIDELLVFKENVEKRGVFDRDDLWQIFSSKLIEFMEKDSDCKSCNAIAYKPIVDFLAESVVEGLYFLKALYEDYIDDLCNRLQSQGNTLTIQERIQLQNDLRSTNEIIDYIDQCIDFRNINQRTGDLPVNLREL